MINLPPEIILKIARFQPLYIPQILAQTNSEYNKYYKYLLNKYMENPICGLIHRIRIGVIVKRCYPIDTPYGLICCTGFTDEKLLNIPRLGHSTIQIAMKYYNIDKSLIIMNNSVHNIERNIYSLNFEQLNFKYFDVEEYCADLKPTDRNYNIDVISELKPIFRFKDKEILYNNTGYIYGSYQEFFNRLCSKILNEYGLTHYSSQNSSISPLLVNGVLYHIWKDNILEFRPINESCYKCGFTTTVISKNDYLGGERHLCVIHSDLDVISESLKKDDKKCQEKTKKGERCKNRASKIKNERYLCGIHSKK